MSRAIVRPRRILVRLLQRRALGSRDWLGRREPFVGSVSPLRDWPLGSGLAIAGVRSGLRTGGRALAGCDVIDPHSSVVKRHELHVAVELQASIQVGNPYG